MHNLFVQQSKYVVRRSITCESEDENFCTISNIRSCLFLLGMSATLSSGQVCV